MVNGVKIGAVKAVKYLGTWIDEKLDWKTHAKYIIDKIQKPLNIIKVLRGNAWGGHPQILLNVYKGLMRSVIEYNGSCIHI